MTSRLVAGGLAFFLALPSSATAQVSQASAAALGMGFNMTASARGFAAVASNPAGLGHPSSPGFSLAIPALLVEAGLGPVSLGELADWESTLLPDDLKADWLGRITNAGGLTVGGGVDATAFALSVGPLGFQLSALAIANINVTPDVAELLLYGNAGRTGSPADLTLQGSAIDGFAMTTTAVSYGLRVSPRIYLGATGKYTMGNGLLVARDGGSTLNSSPLGASVEFPSVRSDTDRNNHGTGVGLDVGALWVGPALTLGATVQNVFHTLEWKLDDFLYVPGEALLVPGDTDSDFDERPASSAPQSLLDVVGERTIKPVLSVGAELRPSSLLKIQADVRKRVSGGLEIGPEFHAGVGVELRALSFLPLRAHGAIVTGGAQFGGGASLVLGPVNLSGAGAVRTGDADAVLAMFTLSFGAN